MQQVPSNGNCVTSGWEVGSLASPVEDKNKGRHELFLRFRSPALIPIIFNVILLHLFHRMTTLQLPLSDKWNFTGLHVAFWFFRKPIDPWLISYHVFNETVCVFGVIERIYLGFRRKPKSWSFLLAWLQQPHGFSTFRLSSQSLLCYTRTAPRDTCWWRRSCHICILLCLGLATSPSFPGHLPSIFPLLMVPSYLYEYLRILVHGQVSERALKVLPHAWLDREFSLLQLHTNRLTCSAPLEYWSSCSRKSLQSQGQGCGGSKCI